MAALFDIKLCLLVVEIEHTINDHPLARSSSSLIIFQIKMASQGLRVLFFGFGIPIYTKHGIYSIFTLYPNMLLHINVCRKGFSASVQWSKS